MDNLSIYLVDDHQLFREGLRLLLTNIDYIGEVLEAENGKIFLDKLSSPVPDIVFMDIQMPVMNGLEATRLAVSRYPGIRIIALSIYDEEEYYTKMIDAGVMGFMLKNSSISDIEDAISSVMSGKNYFSPEILASLVKGFYRKRKTAIKGDLTERECEILFLISRGYSNREIAGKLSISKRTVDKHRENLLLKTNSKNTAGLVMFAIRTGITAL